MTRAAQHYTALARQAEASPRQTADRFGIGDAKLYKQQASMDRARDVRRQVLDFVLGVAVGIVVLFVMAGLGS